MASDLTRCVYLVGSGYGDHGGRRPHVVAEQQILAAVAPGLLIYTEPDFEGGAAATFVRPCEEHPGMAHSVQARVPRRRQMDRRGEQEDASTSR
jgi:hypothetical protein